MPENDTFTAFWDSIAAQVAREESETEQLQLIRYPSASHDEPHDEQLPVYSKEDPLKTKGSLPLQDVSDGAEPGRTSNNLSRRAFVTSSTTPNGRAEIASRIDGFGPGSNDSAGAPSTHSSQTFQSDTPESTHRRLRRRNKKICCWTTLAIVIVALVVGVAVPVVLKKKAQAREAAENRPLTYKLAQTYSGEDFFDNFDFFTDTRSESFQNSFVNRTEAFRLNLTSVLPDGNISLGINNESSVRLSSKRTFTRGLFVFRIKDVPMGCDRTPTIRLSSNPGYPAANDITMFQTRGLTGDRYFGATTNGSCQFATNSRPASITTGKVCHYMPSADQQCRSDLSFFISAPNASPITTRIVELSEKGLKTWNYVPPLVEAQIDADVLNLTQWYDPYIFFPSSNCDLTENFQAMHLVADVARCGSYGRYNYGRSWENGDWCEQECKETTGRPGTSGYYNSTTWKWSEWKVYLPINETSGDWLYP